MTTIKEIKRYVDEQSAEGEEQTGAKASMLDVVAYAIESIAGETNRDDCYTVAQFILTHVEA